MRTFTAFCAKGHDRVDFTDPATFEAHAKGVHKTRKLGAGTGKLAKPLAWRAPRAPATTEKLEAVLAKASSGGYDLTFRKCDWQHGLPQSYLDTEWSVAA